MYICVCRCVHTPQAFLFQCQWFLQNKKNRGKILAGNFSKMAESIWWKISAPNISATLHNERTPEFKIFGIHPRACQPVPHTHTYTDSSIKIYAYTYTSYIYKHTHISMNLKARKTYIYIYIYIYIYTHKHAHIYTCTQTRAHTYIHIYIYIYI